MKQRFNAQLVTPSSDQPQGESNPSNGDASTAQPLFAIKELKDQGPNLPVGVQVGDTRVRPFRLRPFRLREEKELSKMKESAKGTTIGSFVAQVLGTMIQTVGPHNFDQMKERERELIVSRLTMADVLYIYLYLRFEALGDEEPVVMQIRCPNCTNEFRWYGDLGSLEVRVVEDDKKPLNRKYTMRDGITVQGQTRRTVTLAPITWGVFMKPEFSSPAKRIAATLMHSIVGVEGVDTTPFQMSESEMDDLTKYDYSGLVANINEHTPGPQLIVKPKCPACDFVSAMMMDWGWDSFFSRSAQPIRGPS